MGLLGWPGIYMHQDLNCGECFCSPCQHLHLNLSCPSQGGPLHTGTGMLWSLHWWDLCVCRPLCGFPVLPHQTPHQHHPHTAQPNIGPQVAVHTRHGTSLHHPIFCRASHTDSRGCTLLRDSHDCGLIGWPLLSKGRNRLTGCLHAFLRHLAVGGGPCDVVGAAAAARNARCWSRAPPISRVHCSLLGPAAACAAWRCGSFEHAISQEGGVGGQQFDETENRTQPERDH
mmetsp:Transcript_11764/g.20957  ORF Transcript_11764/g.20957 Transcript_11764/m.20957 type:complete len:229 (-) Transcript_11764:1211-1897(-)